MLRLLGRDLRSYISSFLDPPSKMMLVLSMFPDRDRRIKEIHNINKMDWFSLAFFHGYENVILYCVEELDCLPEDAEACIYQAARGKQDRLLTILKLTNPNIESEHILRGAAASCYLDLIRRTIERRGYTGPDIYSAFYDTHGIAYGFCSSKVRQPLEQFIPIWKYLVSRYNAMNMFRDHRIYEVFQHAGRVDFMKWHVAEYGIWYASITEQCFSYHEDRMEILNFLKSIGRLIPLECDIPSDIRLDQLIWGLENNVLSRPKHIDYSNYANNPPVLMWLAKDKSLRDVLYAMRHQCSVEWIHALTQRFDIADIAKEATRRGYMTVLFYLHASGLPWNPHEILQTFDDDFSNNATEFLKEYAGVKKKNTKKKRKYIKV